MRSAFRCLSAAVLVASACTPLGAQPSATSPVPSPTRTVSVNPSPTGPPTESLAPPPTGSRTPPSGAPAQIRTVQLLSGRVGWVAVSQGSPTTSLLRTSDGGATWTPLVAPPFTRIDRLQFVDERNGWALAFVVRDRPEIGCMQASPAAPCRSVVLATADGGRTWHERLSVPVHPASGAEEPIKALEAVDATHAWVLAVSMCGLEGCQQEVRVTSDGGATWRAVGPGGYYPFLLGAASRDIAWVVAGRLGREGEVVLGTTDGGTTWREQRAALEARFIDAVSDREVWVLTRDGAYCTSSGCQRYELLRTTDGGARWSSLGNPKQAACSGGHLGAPVFATARIGWMPIGLDAGGVNVGPGGIMSTSDGGSVWSCATTPPNVTHVSAADADHVWAVSDDRTTLESSLHASDDGGRTWRELRYR